MYNLIWKILDWLFGLLFKIEISARFISNDFKYDRTRGWSFEGIVEVGGGRGRIKKHIVLLCYLVNYKNNILENPFKNFYWL